MRRIAVLPSTLEARRRFRDAELDHWRPSLARAREQTLRDIDDGRLAVPTLVMWGGEDRSAPRHLGMRLFERIAKRTPTAVLQMINGAGHYVFRDRPVLFGEALAAFCLGRGGAADGG
jgi:pimeloyl-ACP methyl ester carboxylesterase